MPLHWVGIATLLSISSSFAEEACGVPDAFDYTLQGGNLTVVLNPQPNGVRGCVHSSGDFVAFAVTSDALPLSVPLTFDATSASMDGYTVHDGVAFGFRGLHQANGGVHMTEPFNAVQMVDFMSSNDLKITQYVLFWSEGDSQWFSLKHSSVEGVRDADVQTHVYMTNPFQVGNHNPTFQLKGIDVSVAEDSGIYTDGDQYVTNIDDVNQFTQSVRFTLTNSFNRLFDTQPHLIGCNSAKCLGTMAVPTTAGSLHFSVAPNMFGIAIVTVVAVDDGIEYPVCNGPPTVPKCVPTACVPALCTNSDPQTFIIEVLPVNDEPSFDHKGDVTSPEDQPTCHDDWASSITAGGWGEDFMQPDAQPLTFTLTTGSPHLFKTVPYLLYRQGDLTASLCYEPAANKVGQSSVSITLTDGGNPPLSFPTQYITVTITEVNDPPSFVPAMSTIEILEDSGEYEGLYAKDMVPGPQEEIDMNQKLQKFTLHFVNQAQSTLFEILPEIDVTTGKLRFKPLPDVNTFSGSVNLKIYLEDRVDAPGAPAVSEEFELTITITPVNDAPSFSPPPGDAALEVMEDQSITESISWAQRVCIGGTLPDHCVFLEAEPNGENQKISFTLTHISGDVGVFKPDMQPEMDPTGRIMFHLEKNKAGDVLYRVSQTDSGPYPNVGPEHDLTIRVLPINDAPSFEVPRRSVSVLEDSGVAHSVTGNPNFHYIEGFLTDVRRGPLEPDEGSQTITCIITDLSNPSLFHPIDGMPAIEITFGGTRGTLVFRTMKNAKGRTEAVVECKDNGGTANGGEDTAPRALITITIGGVSDAPSFNLRSEVVVVEDNGARNAADFVVPNVATQILAGVDEDDAEAVRFDVTTNNTAVFSELPHLSDDGALLFTLLPNFNGNISLSVTAYDTLKSTLSNITTKGLSSNTSTTTLVVLPYNDPPEIVIDGSIIVQSGAEYLPVEIPLCIGKDRDPLVCEYTLKGCFSEISAGPADELLSGQTLIQNDPIRGANISFPSALNSFIEKIDISNRIIGAALGFGGHDLIFSMKRQPLKEYLEGDALRNIPGAFTINVTVADDGPLEGRAYASRELLMRVQLVAGYLGDTTMPTALQVDSNAVATLEGDSSRVSAKFVFVNSFSDPVAVFLRDVNVTLINDLTNERYPMVIEGLSSLLLDQQNVWNTPVLALLNAVSPRVPRGAYVAEAVARLQDNSILFARTSTVLVDSVPVVYTMITPSGASPVVPNMVGIPETYLRAVLDQVAVEAVLSDVNTTGEVAYFDMAAFAGGVQCELEEVTGRRLFPSCTVVFPLTDPQYTSGMTSSLQVRFGGTQGWLSGRSGKILQSNNTAFDIASDATLRVTLPATGLSSQAGYGNVATIPVLASTQLALRSSSDALTESVETLSFTVSEVREGKRFYMVLSGGLQWSASEANVATVVRAFRAYRADVFADVVSPAGPHSFSVRNASVLPKVLRISNEVLEIAVGPDAGYNPPFSERLVVDAAGVVAFGAVVNPVVPLATVSGAALEVVGSVTLEQTMKGVTLRCEGDKDASKQKTAMIVLFVLAVLLSLVSGMAGGVHSSVFPAVLAGVLQAVPASCNQVLLSIAEGSAWVLHPISSDSTEGYETLLNVLIAVIIMVVCAVVVKVGSKGSALQSFYARRFPSIPLAAVLLLTYGALFCSTSGVFTSPASIICAVLVVILFIFFVVLVTEGVVGYCHSIGSHERLGAVLLTDLPEMEGRERETWFTRLQQRVVPIAKDAHADLVQLLNYLEVEGSGVRLQTGLWSGETAKGLGVMFQWAHPGRKGAGLLRVAGYSEAGFVVLPAVVSGFAHSGGDVQACLVVLVLLLAAHAVLSAVVDMRVSVIYRAFVVFEGVLTALIACILLHYHAGASSVDTSTWHGNVVLVITCIVLVAHCVACIVLMVSAYHVRQRGAEGFGKELELVSSASSVRTKPSMEPAPPSKPTYAKTANPIDTVFEAPKKRTEVVREEEKKEVGEEDTTVRNSGSCPECGSRVAQTGKFCHTCGHSFV